MLQPYYEIVEKQRGEMVVSHRTIAEYTGIQDHSISRIIREHRADFEYFGHLGFKIHTVRNSVGAANEVKTYYLNEQQATLLMTYLKNTPNVRVFKKALVEEFFLMREQTMKQLKFTKDGKNRMLSCGAHKGNYRKARKSIKILKAKLAEAEKWRHVAEIAYGMAASERDNLKKELAWYKEKTKNLRFGSYR